MCNKCCFCCSLKTGTILAGVYSLIVGAIGAIQQALILLGARDLKNIFQDEDVTYAANIIEISCYVAIGLMGAWVLTAIIMLAGVCSKTRCCLLPWCIITPFLTAILVWVMWSYIKKLLAGETDTTVLSMLSSYAISILINVYILLIVISYYRKNMNEDEIEHQPVPQC